MTIGKPSALSWLNPKVLISRGRWFVPFAIGSVIWIAGYAVSYHARLDVMHAMLPATATAADHAEAEAAMLSLEPVRTLFLPIRNLIGGSMLVFVLFSFIRLLEPPKPLRMAQAATLVFVSDVSLAVGYLLAWVFPPSALRFPIPPAALSLRMWIDSPSWITNMILGCMNPFQWAAIAGMGLWLAGWTEMGKGKGIFIALAITALAVFTQICLVQFVGMNVGILQ